MPIRIQPYATEHEPLIQDLNRRLADGGSDWAFYKNAKPRWLPEGVCPNVHRTYFVAVEDGAHARAGYCLKFETFLLEGEPVEMASLQGPVSEGLVDPAQGMLAFRLFRDMEDRAQRIFAWGASHRVLGLMERLKWRQFRMPLQVKVLRSRKFMSEARLLRRSPRMGRLLDLLAASGLGAIGLSLAQFGLQALAGTPSGKAVISERVQAFGDWADEIWQACRGQYRLIALRDAATLNALLPHDGWPHATILKVTQGDDVVGWAAVRRKEFIDDARFGTQNVGLVVDALAKPGFETSVAREAMRFLKRDGVDVIVSNFTHPTWRRALAAAGFFSISERRSLVLSPGFMSALKSDDVITTGMHLTPLDGDGPLGY